MIASLFRYYGTDLLGICFSFLMLFLLGSQKRIGFLCGATANVCWSIFGVITHSLPLILANIVFCGLNIRGYFRWTASSVLLPGSEQSALNHD